MRNSDNNTGNEQIASPRASPGRMAMGNDEEGIDLRELIAALRGGKWIIAGITAVVLALALLYAFLATPVYQADTLIQIEQQNQSPFGTGASADILSSLMPMAEPAEAEIAIMTSRSVLKPTVEKEHLNIEVDAGGLPVIGHLMTGKNRPRVSVDELQVPDDWMDEGLELKIKGKGNYVLSSPSGDKVLEGTVGNLDTARGGAVKILVGSIDAPPGKSFTVTRLYDQEAIANLKKSLNAAEQGDQTGIVSVTLEGSKPAQVKSVLNTMANQYMKQNVAEMSAQAQKSLDFVNERLPKIKKQLNSAQNKLTAYKTKNGAVDLDQQAQAMLQNLTALEAQLTQLDLAEAAMRQRYTGRYPGLQALENQRRDIQKKIKSLRTQINLLPEQEQGYVDLMQKVQVYQQLYTTLLAKAQDLQIAQAGTVGSARIVDYAVKPIEPIAPRRAIVSVVGLILGLFLGVLVVILRQTLSRAVQDATEIEREFGLPVYAVVPHSKRQGYLVARAKRKGDKSTAGQIGLLAMDDPHDPTVESIRSLRTSLNFALQGGAQKVITIGGASPGVGKSFLSVNLAHVMATSGAHVLVIDADMRRGHLEKYLGGRKQPGLSQVLSGQVGLQEAIQPKVHIENLDFLASGPYPPNPYELMSSPRLEALIADCADKYDMVVIDLPPVLSVAEGLLAARVATANLLVVKAGVQTLREMQLTVERMRQNGISLTGFIFNDLTKHAAAYTYGRYANAYYSRYGGRLE